MQLKHRHALIAVFLVAIIGLAGRSERAAAAEAMPWLRGEGTHIVDPAGKTVILRGCNLGNWLMIEPWMLGGTIDTKDQGELTDLFKKRFGDECGYALMEQYRSNYITARDLELVKKFNFNLVRLPFDFRLLQDENPPYAMRADAFKWLDHALDLAEQAGLYVILDMHGTPGGNSNQMHTGRSDQPGMWNDAPAQTRFVDLWTKLAQHYKDRSVIVAYDVVNEPFADYKTDVTPVLKVLIPRVFEAIRATGDKHLVLFPQALGNGVYFYGDVKARGYQQFAFTDHFYPGLFGSPSTLTSHANTILRDFPDTQRYLDQQQAPFLAGEFNVVLNRCGGALTMRRYYDEFAQRGWMATMWSYKLLKKTAGVEGDNWYMITNAGPLNAIDVKSDSYGAIDAFMKSMSTIPLVADETLRDALTNPNAKGTELPPLPVLPKSAPAAQSAGGWTGVAVGDASGGLEMAANDSVIVTARGKDIFGSTDDCYFVGRDLPAKSKPTLLVARVERLLESGSYAKAGLMLRIGKAGDPSFASAPYAMINVFPDGTIAFLHRNRQGAGAEETKRFAGPLPRRIGLLVDGAKVQALVEDAAGQWISAGEATLPAAPAGGQAKIGFAVAGNSASAFTQATFSNVKLSSGADAHVDIRPHASSAAAPKDNLLKNGSFDEPAGNAEEAAGWNRWGNVHTATAPTLTINGEGDIGFWQDVTVKQGQSFRFTIAASRAAGKMKNAGNVELRLEDLSGPAPMSIASKEFDAEWIETTPGKSTLTITGTAGSEKLRVLVRVNSATKVHEDLTMTFDDAVFEWVR